LRCPQIREADLLIQRDDVEAAKDALEKRLEYLETRLQQRTDAADELRMQAAALDAAKADALSEAKAAAAAAANDRRDVAQLRAALAEKVQ